MLAAAALASAGSDLKKGANMSSIDRRLLAQFCQEYGVPVDLVDAVLELAADFERKNGSRCWTVVEEGDADRLLEFRVAAGRLIEQAARSSAALPSQNANESDHL